MEIFLYQYYIKKVLEKSILIYEHLYLHLKIAFKMQTRSRRSIDEYGEGGGKIRRGGG